LARRCRPLRREAGDGPGQVRLAWQRGPAGGIIGGQHDDVAVFTDCLPGSAAGLDAETAVQGDAEVGQELRGGRLTPPQPRFAVQGQHEAEEHAGVAGLKIRSSSLRR
jgi:hypothetical protein